MANFFKIFLFYTLSSSALCTILTEITTVNFFPTKIYFYVYTCKFYVFFLRKVVNMRNAEHHGLIILFRVPFCTLTLVLSVEGHPQVLRVVDAVFAQVSWQSRASKSVGSIVLASDVHSILSRNRRKQNSVKNSSERCHLMSFCSVVLCNLIILLIL